MRFRIFPLLWLISFSACSDREVRRHVVVEQTRQEPVREVVVEQRMRPNFGETTRETVVEERLVPRERIRRTETVTTTQE